MTVTTTHGQRLMEYFVNNLTIPELLESGFIWIHTEDADNWEKEKKAELANGDVELALNLDVYWRPVRHNEQF